MRKTICKICGTTYDLDEWVECPECAKKEYELGRRRQYPKPFVFTINKPIKLWWLCGKRYTSAMIR